MSCIFNGFTWSYFYLICLTPTVSLPGPSAVEGLKVSQSSGSLDVSWWLGPGRVDGIRVLLIDGQNATWNETLETTATSYRFIGLIPGRRYNITAVTEAGGQRTLFSMPTQTGRGRQWVGDNWALNASAIRHQNHCGCSRVSLQTLMKQYIKGGHIA